MKAIDDLLALAEDCYAQAKNTINLVTKAELMNMGERYVQMAEAMQRERSVVVQAVFPKSDTKIG